MLAKIYPLLRIISGMRKDARIKATFDSITESENNTVLVGLLEVLVEQYLQLFMQKLPVAMR